MQIKKIREEKNLTQDELAKEAGISVRTLQRIEAGKKPKGHTKRVLAKALDMEMDAFDQAQKDSFNLTMIKLINLSSILTTWIPFLNVITPLVISFFTKQSNRLTRQIISLQIFWSILSLVIFIISALMKNALSLSNQFTLWVLVVLVLSNVIMIIINTISIDNKGELKFRLHFEII